MFNQIKIAIVICTSNRTDILVHTLRSVSNEIKDYAHIFLIDNNRNGISQAIRNEIKSIPLTILHEPKTGLSHARNKALAISDKFEWLIYLDDDIEIPKDFFPKLNRIISNDQFDCFGGMYYPWYPEGKPKWLPNDFGKKVPLRSDTGSIHLLDDGFLSGGILAVKKEALEAIGGFRTDLGMTDGIGYGEEDDLQLRLQAAAYRIGFVPDWYMQHAVLAHKHKVSWHLKSAYAHGRDAQQIHKTYSRIQISIKLLQVIITAVIKRGPIALCRWLFQKEYYWQNALLYTFEPVYGWAGKWKGAIT